jgi:release factor glutamine methyltransferase
MAQQQSNFSLDWTVLKVLQWTTQYFQTHGIDSPRLTAEILLAHALQSSRLSLYLHYDQPLSLPERDCFKKLIQRRCRREPVAYITGKKGFFDLDLVVAADVLIPRPETETLIETALDVIPKDGEDCCWQILDAGTGSGAVVLSLAKNRSGHRYVATDRSMAALHLARENGRQIGIGNICWVCADWLDAFCGAESCLDLVVSNPPYIPSAQIDRLEPEVCRYEPRMALDGGMDGLDAIRRLVDGAGRALKPGGILMMEIGYDQGMAVTRMLEAAAVFEAVGIRKDLGGRDRVIQARRKAD